MGGPGGQVVYERGFAPLALPPPKAEGPLETGS
jgi:hypothetical protein